MTCCIPHKALYGKRISLYSLYPVAFNLDNILKPYNLILFSYGLASLTRFYFPCQLVNIVPPRAVSHTDCFYTL